MARTPKGVEEAAKRNWSERIEAGVQALEYAEQEIVHLRRTNEMLRMRLEVWDQALNLINGQSYWQRDKYGSGMVSSRDRVTDLAETSADLRNLIGKGK